MSAGRNYVHGIRRRRPKRNSRYWRTQRRIPSWKCLLHLLMRWWAPADDDLAELRSFAERGIARARQLCEHGSEAAFHAQGAAFTALELNRLLIDHRFSAMINVMVGLPPTDEMVRGSDRVLELATSFSAHGSAAVDSLMRGASASEVSSALQILANAVGQTAHTLRASGAATEADRYLAHSKKLFLTAKDASAAAGDELGAVNAMFNLANQIRFHGGERRAWRWPSGAGGCPEAW